MEGVTVYPSAANYILFRLAPAYDAGKVWQQLLDAGVLIRDFSRAKGLENSLRVSVGSPEENTRFLEELRNAL